MAPAAVARPNLTFPQWVVDCPCNVSTLITIDEASTEPQYPSKWSPRFCPNCGQTLGRGRAPVQVKEPLYHRPH